MKIVALTLALALFSVSHAFAQTWDAYGITSYSSPSTSDYVQGGGPSGFNLGDVPDAVFTDQSVTVLPHPNSNKIVYGSNVAIESIDSSTASYDVDDSGTIYNSSTGVVAVSEADIVTASSNTPGLSGLGSPSWRPTDAANAVSPLYAIAVVNDVYYIWDRSQGVLLKPKTGNQFWCNGPQVVTGCPGTNNNFTSNPLSAIDPQIVYDAVNSRWITTALGRIVDRQLQTTTKLPFTYIAVSQTSNPLGQWNLFWFWSCGDGSNGDEPALGINPAQNWAFVHNKLCTKTTGYPKHDLHVFYLPALYSGTPPNDLNHFQLDDPNDQDYPVRTYNAYTPEYLVTSDVPYPFGRPKIVYSWIIADPLSGKPRLVSSAALTKLPPTNATYTIPQAGYPNCSQCLYSSDAAILSATVQTLSNGKPVLVVPVNVGLQDANGILGTKVVAAVEDVSIVNTPKMAMPPVMMKTTAKGTYFYSSAALTGDGQTLVLQNLGTTRGSSGSYPYDQVSVIDLSGTFIKTVVKKGSGQTPLSPGRWGDYSSAVPDPAFGNSVWTLGSYLGSDGTQQNWLIKITR